MLIKSWWVNPIHVALILIRDAFVRDSRGQEDAVAEKEKVGLRVWCRVVCRFVTVRSNICWGPPRQCAFLFFSNFSFTSRLIVGWNIWLISNSQTSLNPFVLREALLSSLLPQSGSLSNKARSSKVTTLSSEQS